MEEKLIFYTQFEMKFALIGDRVIKRIRFTKIMFCGKFLIELEIEASAMTKIL